MIHVPCVFQQSEELNKEEKKVDETAKVDDTPKNTANSNVEVDVEQVLFIFMSDTEFFYSEQTL